MSKKQNALNALENAKKEYEGLYEEYMSIVEELNNLYDSSDSLLSDVGNLIDSIRHKPIKYNSAIKKIEKQKELFLGKEELIRKERKDKAIAGLAAVGAAGLAAVTLKGVIEEMLEDKKGWVITIIILLIALLVFVVRWLISKITIRRSHSEIRKIKKACIDIKKDIATYTASYSMISERFNAVSIYYDNNKELNGFDYRQLASDEKKSLIAMVNGAETLSELLNRSLE